LQILQSATVLASERVSSGGIQSTAQQLVNALAKLPGQCVPGAPNEAIAQHRVEELTHALHAAAAAHPEHDIQPQV
jgi:hypothetical protein